MEMKTGLSPISAGSAIDSFRDMGFKTDSAIGEIIDNSIEADARNIDILINYKDKELMQKQRRIKSIIFIDDGRGMTSDILLKFLIIGEGTKKELKSGIGKFGVGATFAGISQGKLISVYSKTKTGNWMYTQLDLDLLKKGEGIPIPVEKNPPDNYIEKLDEQGTIVIWDKIDSSTTEKDLESIKHNIGRIYRKFISIKKLEGGRVDDNEKIIRLRMNGENVAPYDPLYLTYNPKSDESDLAELGESKIVPINSDGIKSEMRITFSYLPESWWDDEDKMYKPGQNTENKVDRKISIENQGISIVRAGKEMAFGEIPHLKLLKKDNEDGGSSFKAADRFTGVEVSFERDADKVFGIEANKSKLFLPRYIRELIGRTLRDPLETRREYFTTTRGNKSKKGKKRVNKSKKIIQNTMNSPNYSDEEKKEIREFAESIAKGPQEFEDMYEDLIKGYLPIESWDLDPKGPFVRYEHKLESIIVKYNMNHIFMKKFFETLSDIAERKGEEPSNALKIEEIQRTKTLFDLLLASYGLSEIAFTNPDDKAMIQTTIDDLRINWGKISDKISSSDIKSE
jgi:hypothetical protein